MKWGKVTCLLLLIFVFYVYCHYEKRNIAWEPMTSNDIVRHTLLSSGPYTDHCPDRN
jgi:hypothetical protein